VNHPYFDAVFGIAPRTVGYAEPYEPICDLQHRGPEPIVRDRTDEKISVFYPFDSCAPTLI
jgi:hypothetical protein